MPRVIDLTGQTFGRLTVLNRSEKKDGEREAYWDCICECGKRIRTRGTMLRAGRAQSCGCLAAEKVSERQLIDISGLRFGRLIVKDRCEKQGKVVYWNCLCDCGKTVEVSSQNLRYGQTQSCGCLQREKTSLASVIDITGQRFGKLTVLSKADSKNGKAYWLCQCDCGKKTTVAGHDLRNGDTQSCGCLISTAELEISQILQDINIEYETQKKYVGLVGTGGGLLRFDFYLPKYNMLIEYQGKQHYTPFYRFGGEEAYQKGLIHDEIKREYCKKNGIKLLEIPYWERSNLREILTQIKEEQNENWS